MSWWARLLRRRNLEEQLETRRLVDRAKGLLMDNHGMREADAFSFIQKTAMQQRLTMKVIAQSVIEGQFITPSIVGRRMTVNPFAIFLSVAFWVWLWGPLGALLGMPILIASMVVRAHIYPKDGIAPAK